MIQTATLSPMLPTQARSTTVQNGSTPGDFAGSFAQANDDAAADGAPKTPMPMPTPIVAIPALSPGTIARQDAAVTGNTLPTPAVVTETAHALVPEIAAVEPLAPAAIPAKAGPAVTDVAVKRTGAARPTIVARPAAFAVSPRNGKAKADAPTTASDDTIDAPLADQPALPGLTAIAQPAIDPPVIAQPLVQANPDVLPVAAPLAPSPSPEGITTIVAKDAIAPVASAIGGAKPIGTGSVGEKPLATAEPDLTTPATPAASPATRQSLPTASIAQDTAVPVTAASARPAPDRIDPGQASPPQVTPVAATPVTNSPLQIPALAAAVPVASQFSTQLGATSPLSAPAPLADTAPTATPRWVANDATTPVALAVALPAAVQPQPGTVASASQVFGAAIQAAKARDERDAADPTAPLIAANAPVSPLAIKTAEAQQAPLDMRQERWPHAMIERIEILRDAADATDTRIRLVPDALGAIDVSMRKDGDTVHVHFNADQAATRTLLADAQPRLAELAEARGLKLGQGALGDTNTGSNQQRAPAPSKLPNRTTTASAVIADAADETRIA